MIAEVLTGVVILVLTIYFYLTWNYNYWHKKGITHLQPVFPGLGNLLDIILCKKGGGNFHTEIYRKYPEHPVIGFYTFREPALLVRDPEIIQSVLVTKFSKFRDNYLKISEDQEPLTTANPFFVDKAKWKETRAALAPAFTVNRVKHFYPKMQELCNKLVQHLEKHVNENIEAKNLAYMFTTDTIATCGFGIASNAVSGEETMFLKYCRLITSELLENGLSLFIMYNIPLLSKFLNIKFVPDKVCSFIEEIVDTVINYRKKNGVTENDYLQLLLKNREKSLLEAKPNDKSAQERSQRVLLGHAVTFFMESYEATSSVISYIMYELAINTDIQEKLSKELGNAVTESPKLDYDTLIRLPYLDKVVSETLRKYPPVISMAKMCVESTTLEVDGKAIEIEAGTSIVIPTYALHNDSEYFPQPEKFDPERFSKDNVAERHHYCYLPFSEGPRICIGTRFAVAQIKLFVAMVLMNYSILKCEKTPDRLTFNPRTMLLVSNERIWIQLEKRRQ